MTKLLEEKELAEIMLTQDLLKKRLRYDPELLTVERVTEMRDCWISLIGPYTPPELAVHLREKAELANFWLSSRSSEAPSRRGEGEKPLPFKLPVRKYVNRDIEQWGNYGIVDDRDGEVAFCDFEKVADAIVSALNKNTGAS